VERTPLEVLLSEKTTEGRSKAAKNFINSLIEETDCFFILNGARKDNDQEQDTICKSFFLTVLRQRVDEEIQKKKNERKTHSF
jgi:hypothetical protein